MLRIFLRGLFALAPVCLTVYLLFWLVSSIEGMVTESVFKALGISDSIPGLGLITALVVIYAFGLLMGLLPFSRLIVMIQLPFKNIPMVKSIYSAIEDLLYFFSSTADTGAGKVVKVTFPHNQLTVIGLLTRKDFDQTMKLNPATVAVFVPMSYALGGYTIFVPESWTTQVNMPVEQAMKSAITAWMKKDTQAD